MARWGGERDNKNGQSQLSQLNKKKIKLQNGVHNNPYFIISPLQHCKKYISPWCMYVSVRKVLYGSEADWQHVMWAAVR